MSFKEEHGLPKLPQGFSAADLPQASLEQLEQFAMPPRKGERRLYKRLLTLPPIVVERYPLPFSVSAHCHDNVSSLVASSPPGAVTPVVGWIDTGTYMVLHSVAYIPQFPEEERYVCITPGDFDWLVFRPDPELRLTYPWRFKLNSAVVPPTVRRDPEASAAAARQALRELQKGTFQGWADEPLFTGLYQVEKPEGMPEWVAYRPGSDESRVPTAPVDINPQLREGNRREPR